LANRSPDAQTNPHSQCFVPVHHWCNLRITEDYLELAAYRLDGTVIERTQWMNSRPHDILGLGGIAVASRR